MVVMALDKGTEVMDEQDMLATQFEANRAHLRAVAYRMLGSSAEADDAVQECWLRLSRSGTEAVQNLGGWLTTVVARVCLDMLRAHKSRREDPVDIDARGLAAPDNGMDPEQEALLADSVGPALLVVLDTLSPAERIAFVLHDMFAVPFDEIAPIVRRSPVATRQLASRARRRVQGTSSVPEPGEVHQREVVDAFLAASREGRFDALLALLDPTVVLRADQGAVPPGGSAEVAGAAAVANTFSGRAQGARRAVVDGAAGAVWTPGGRPRVVFAFAVQGGKIIEIDLVADPERLGLFDLVILDE